LSAQNPILITGCSTGFGRIAAQTLARKKHLVLAGMRDVRGRNAKNAAELEAFAKGESLPLRVIELDVNHDASVDRAVGEIIRDYGRIDVLVNNAGLSIRGLCETVTVEQARRIFETNVFAVMRMNRAVLPHMRRRGRGLLIHISSQAGRVVIPGFGIYGASKFALEALVESYHYELAGEGIESVSVQPGAYETAISQNADKGADEARAASYGPGAEILKTLLGHLGKRRDPQEVADVIAKLIEMPAGKRPLRTEIGVTGDFVAQLNAFTDKLQAAVLSVLGLSPFTIFRPDSEVRS
jgi:NAD(P)-dependent dehydrogenase (short-subunit alcohol dehydrogenase family)